MSKIKEALEGLIRRRLDGDQTVALATSVDLPSPGCWVWDGWYKAEEYAGNWIIRGKKAIAQAEKISTLRRVYTGELFNIYEVKSDD